MESANPKPKRALVIWGGYEGHEPEVCAGIFTDALRGHGFDVVVSNTLDSLLDMDLLEQTDLIVPTWTTGEISQRQLAAFTSAVEQGTGLAGCHAGMCDAFRAEWAYQHMTGGQWVAHPGGANVTFTVNVRDTDHFITKGATDFELTSEHYYLLTDPANRVLATTPFPVADGPHVANGPFEMPVVWTRRHGSGRVFYCSIGHRPDELRLAPVRELWLRGFLWAGRAPGTENE